MRHLAAAAFFAAMGVVWSFPLAWHLSTHLPGAGLGDNADFLWNFWWMRIALASGVSFFHTTYLFAPAGADLTLHTHTALPAFVGATVLGRLPVVTAQNLTVLSSLALNGFCAYLLAWRFARDYGAALVAGIVFGGSPYIAAHLNGHFNLTMAWTIPLFVLALSETIGGAAAGWAALAGALLGATAYVDYYYLVYEAGLAVCLTALAAREWSIVCRGASLRSRRLMRVVGGLIAVDTVVLAALTITGRGFFNPLQVFWALVVVLLWLRLRPRIVARRSETWEPVRQARAMAILAIVFLIVAAPLVWRGALLFLRGEYVTPQYFWRSAPKGIDLATLTLGNPFHPLWGGAVQRVYSLLGIDLIESTAWLGIVPMLLAAWALRYARRSPIVRQWAVIGLLSFVWALGPHLMAFGVNSGMILPQALVRYLPIVANARIPGRAMVIMYLALAMLSATALAEWRAPRSRILMLAGVSLVLVADFFPAPFPLVELKPPGIYETLRDRPERGAVCELPLGIRDGFGEQGAFDDRVLFYQTIHGRPLVGGFVARLPRAVVEAYDGDPLLAGLLRLSARDHAVESTQPLPDRQLAADRLREDGIAFVVLNRETASGALADYVDRVLPLARVADEGGRSLYLVSR